MAFNFSEADQKAFLARLEARRVPNASNLPAKEAPASARTPTNTSAHHDSTASSSSNLQKASASTDRVAAAPVFTPKASSHETGVSDVTSLLSTASIDDDVRMEDVSQAIESNTQQPSINPTPAHVTAVDTAPADDSAQRRAKFESLMTGSQRRTATKDPADRTASTMRESKWADPAPRTPVVSLRRDSIHSLMSQSDNHSVLEYQKYNSKPHETTWAERKALAAERQAWVDRVIRDNQIKKALESSPQPAGTASSSSPIALTPVEQFHLDVLGVHPSVSKHSTPTPPSMQQGVHSAQGEAKSSDAAVKSSPTSQTRITPQATLSGSATPASVTKVQRQVLSEHTSMRKDSAVGIAETKNTRPIAQAHRHPVSADLKAPVPSVARDPEAPPPARALAEPTSPTKRAASAAEPSMPPPKRVELEKSSFTPFDENQTIEMRTPSIPAVKAAPRLEMTTAVPKPVTSTNEEAAKIAAVSGATSSTTLPIPRRLQLASSPQLPLSPNESGAAGTPTPAPATTPDPTLARRRRIATVRIVEDQVPANSTPDIRGGPPEPASSPQLPFAPKEPAVERTHPPTPTTTSDTPVARRRRIVTVRIVEDGGPASSAPVTAGEQPQLKQAISAGQFTQPIKDLTNTHVASQPAPVKNIQQQSLPVVKLNVAHETMADDQAKPSNRTDTVSSYPSSPAARPGSSTVEDPRKITGPAPAPAQAASTMDANRIPKQRPDTHPSRPVAPDARPSMTPISNIMRPAPPVAATASTSSIPTGTDGHSTSTGQRIIGQAPTATASPGALVRPRRKIATVRIVGEDSSPAKVVTTQHTPSHTRDNSSGLVSGFQRLSISPPPSTKTTPTTSGSKDLRMTSSTMSATEPVSAAPVSARAPHPTTFEPIRDTSVAPKPESANVQQVVNPDAAFLAAARSKIPAKVAKGNARSISSTLRAQQVPLSAAEETKNTNRIFFDSWATPVDRGRPAAKIRSVHLRNLPPNTTSYIVSTLVWGGDIEHIEYADGNLSAKVRFVNAEACQSYFDKTANGIKYPPGAGIGKAVWVELASEVEPLSGNLLDAIERREATRCVRAIGVDADLTIDALTRIAEGAKRDVKVLRVFDEPPNGSRKHRSVQWQFKNIKDADIFMRGLIRNDDFERCNITFANDPCAKAETIHA